jgi:autotransporter-associated beta strand protein
VLSESLPIDQQPTLALGAFFPLVLDSVNPSRLLIGGIRYAPTYPGLPLTGPTYPSPTYPSQFLGFSAEESLDGGQTWTSLSPNQAFATGAANQLPFDFTVTQLAIAAYQGTYHFDPGFPLVADTGANTYDPNTIYAIGFEQTTDTTSTARLFVTKDHGNNWVQRNNGLPPLSVSSTIVVDPRNRDTAYILEPAPTDSVALGNIQGRIYKTTDAGQNWTAIGNSLPDVPTWSLVVDPRTGNLYVGNDVGVYVSADQGATWAPFGSGMPNVQVRQMIINPILNTLTAVTYGRGMFQLFLDNAQANSGAFTAVSGNNVWTGPVQLTGTQPGASVTIGAFGSQVLQNGLTTAQLTIKGTVSDLTPGGNYQLIKIGQGNVALGGANTYGGFTHVEQGVLITQSSTALGNPNAPEMQSVGVTGTAGAFTLTFNGQTTTSLPFNATAVQVQSALTALSTIGGAGGTVAVALTNGTYTITFGGNLNNTNLPLMTGKGTGGTSVVVSAIVDGGTGTLVEPDAAVELASNLQLESITLQGDGIPFSGHNTGALRSIAGANTYTGKLTLATNSTIGVDSGSQLTIGAGAGLSGTGSITDGQGAFSLTKELPGGLILASANSYHGGTNIFQGSLEIQNSLAFGIPGSTASTGVLVLDGAQLRLNSSTGASAGTPLVIQNQPLEISGSGAFNSGALLSTGNNTWQGPITLAKDPSFSPSSTPPDNVTFAIPNAADTLTINGAVGQPASAIVGLYKTGNGKMLLTKADSYGGSTFVNAGILTIQDGSALGAPALGGVQNIITVSPSGTGSFTLSFTKNNVLTVVNGSIPYGAAAATVENALIGIGFLQPKPTPQVTRTTIQILSTSGTPTQGYVYTVQSGSGVLIATGNGSTIPNQVTAAVSPGTGVFVSPGAALDVDGDPKNAGTGITIPAGQEMVLMGNGITSTSAGSAVGAVVNVSGKNNWQGGADLATSTTINTPSGSLAIAGVVDGETTSTLTKIGTGTLFFSGNNTYQGLTQVQIGILNIGNSSSLGRANTPEVQEVLLTNGSVNSTFTLGFNGAFTPALPFNATPLTVQNALNALTTIGGVGGKVTVTPATPTPPTGSTFYLVSFGGSLAGQQLPLLTASATNGTNAAVSMIIIGGGLGTVVSTGAELQMQGNINVANEALSVSGTGVNNAGVIDSLSGNNTWGQPITMASSISIGSEGTSSLAINELDASSSSGFGLTKLGTGTLEFLGNKSNTYPGPTNVNAGTLQLGKTNGAIAVQSSLTIGTGTAQTPPPTVTLLGDNQIVNTTTLTINRGVFDLGNQVQTIGVLGMNGGTVSLTGASSKLTLNPGVTGATFTAGPDNSGNAAIISGAGTLSLGGVNRTLTVNGAGGSIPNLVISAVISGTGTEGLTKTGAGTAALDANNTYTGATTIGQGILLADGPNTANTIGSVSLNGGTLGGKGTVGTIANTTATSKVAPGDSNSSPGTLTSTTTTWNSTTTFFVALNGGTVGQFSQLSVKGNINLGGATLAGVTGGTIAPGTQIPIITTTGGLVSGTFANAAPGQIITLGGQKYGVNYTGTQVVLTAAPKNSALIGLTSSANPSSFGQNVTFTATVTPAVGAPPIPTGDTVTFTIDGVTKGTITLNASGQATLDLSALTPPETLPVLPSPHLVVATFNGDANFNPATTSLQQTVNKANTSIAVSSVPALPVIGQPVTVVATVTAVSPGTGVPTGTVTFIEDGVVQSPPATLSAGKGTFLIPNLTGPHTFKVTYSGDGNYGASTSSTFQLNLPAATTTTIKSSANPSVFGQPVISATVTGVSPSTAKPTDGTVTFVVNGVSLPPVAITAANPGVATLPAGSLPVGVDTVTAAYNGDASGSNSFLPSGPTAPITQTVNKASSTTTISSSANPSTVGQTVTFTANVSGVSPSVVKPTEGTVTFVVDGVSHQVALSSANPGVATYTQSFQTATTHTVSASYGGGASFTASGPANLTQTVSQGANSNATSLAASIATAVSVNNPFAIKVAALTSSNTVASGFTGPATLTVVGVPPLGALKGPMTATFVNGVATFSGLSITTAGTYSVVVTSGTLSVKFTFSSFGRRT